MTLFRWNTLPDRNLQSNQGMMFTVTTIVNTQFVCYSLGKVHLPSATLAQLL